jgi:hypothetical protein
MKRKLNFTGRKRIPKENIKIELNRENEKIKSFDAQINTENLELPKNSNVIVETYFKTELYRYSFGTIGKIEQPSSTDLSHIGFSENLRFRVIVTDDNGKILAMAERIRALNDTEKKSILPVMTKDIGNQLWQLDFPGNEEGPILILNSKIFGIENFAKNDPQFKLSVLPAVLREILTKMIFIDTIPDPEDITIDWHKTWLDFVNYTLKVENQPKILDPHSDDFIPEDVEEWIDRVVENLCDIMLAQSMRVFSNAMSGGDQL